MDVYINNSKVHGTVTAPGSKSLTHRALICAALAPGKSVIENPSMSDDILLTLTALHKLGIKSIITKNKITIFGKNGLLNPSSERCEINAGNSGTTLRFITALSALSSVPITITGSNRLCQRPMKDLLVVLKRMGIKISSSANNYLLPVTIKGNGLRGGKIVISAKISSQFTSAIMFIAPFTQNGLQIEVKDVHAKPYIDLTISVMKAFGVTVKKKGAIYKIASMQKYKNCNFKVEGDLSAASYFFAAAAVTHSEITVTNINRNTKQGDSFILQILTDMGCRVIKEQNQVTVYGNTLKPLHLKMGNFPDLVPTVAALASFAQGVTKIDDLGALRYKESDRLKAIYLELNKMAIKTQIVNNSLIIHGHHPHAATINTHHDHRLAMSLAVVGLGAHGQTIIKNAGVVTKSYPTFWQDFKKVNADIIIKK